MPTPNAGIVNIPDPQLKAAICEALGVPTTTPLTEEDLQRLTTLDAKNRNISDLTRLGHLTNLETLELQGNLISSLTELEPLVKLKTLILSNNQISSPELSPLKDLKNLTHLELENNQIITISDLEGLTKLTYLSLDRNNISDITPLRPLVSLETLKLMANNIGTIRAIENLTNLKNLDIGQNRISNITPLKDLLQLENLSMSYNKVRDISSLQDLSHLKVLKAGGNEISDIFALEDLQQLEHLELPINQITDTSPLANLKRLNNPILYDQQITLPTQVSYTHNLSISNPLIDRLSETVRPYEISDNGQYNAGSNSIEWTNLNGKGTLSFIFNVDYTNPNSFSGIVYQPYLILSGATGPAGPQGATGPTGPRGLNGATGPTGPRGAEFSGDNRQYISKPHSELSIRPNDFIPVYPILNIDLGDNNNLHSSKLHTTIELDPNSIYLITYRTSAYHCHNCDNIPISVELMTNYRRCIGSKAIVTADERQLVELSGTIILKTTDTTSLALVNTSKIDVHFIYTSITIIKVNEE